MPARVHLFTLSFKLRIAASWHKSDILQKHSDDRTEPKADQVQRQSTGREGYMTTLSYAIDLIAQV
ncbi:hypothetical protein RUESEDTHA_03159 [Ruegeria sp. THAF57]|nr:hypothetical protein RUESEDTHA_03159 [Ruegeria sp. THAF57]